MFTNNLIAGASGQGGDFYPTTIEQSLRFNDNDSAYLSRTPASAGNRKTWTWSGWVKPCNTNVEKNLLSVRSGTSYPHMLFWIEDSNSSTRLRILEQTNVANLINVETTASLRDPSAWYHIVLTVDTTEATASDRVKIYINGVQQTALSLTEYPSLNADLVTNSTTPHAIGRRTTNGGASIYSDTYLAEVHFVDGTALDPTSFGELKSGVWVPIEPTGLTYGTNGFYLNFSDSGAIGDDLSGNGNDWTANNLVATDVVLDSPTNNFATWNPVAKNSSFAMTTLSEGNLRSYNGAASNQYSEVSFYLDTTNKYYFEYYNISATTSVKPASLTIIDPINGNANRLQVYITNAGYIYIDTTLIGSGFPTLAAGDILQIAYDGSTGKVWVGKNGTYYNASGTAIGDPAAGTDPIGTLTPTTFKIESTFYQQGCIMNFGQDSSFAGNKTPQGNTDANGIGDFYFAPPSGFLALAAQNLPTPAIDPAKDDVPADYFNTAIYTNQTVITGVGFAPDFVWHKSRNQAYNHYLYDAVRGTGAKGLNSNTTSVEGANDNLGIVSFDSDGVTWSADAGLSQTQGVGWFWKAGNGTSSNTSGSISSTVSVNQKAGFSIVSYTGNGSNNQSVGHGLGKKPSFVIIKNRDAATNWVVLTDLIDGSNDGFYLNTTGAKFDASTNVATDSVFYTVYSASNNMIAYCFAPVESYSAFGKYTGNGSTDGPFIFTNHRPAFLLIKRTDAGPSQWFIWDDARSTYNVNNKELYPNASTVEGTFDKVDFLSNGFKMRTTGADNNANGGTYIYMAFAENPFKYANAR